MSRRAEATDQSVPNPERRKFLKMAMEGGVVLGVGLSIAASVEGIRRNLLNRGNLWGEPIKDEGGKLLVIDPTSGSDQILVRLEPTLDDDNIVGFATAGEIVQARAYWGVVYPGIQGLGILDGPDGEIYGKWFKVQGIKVFREVDGKLQYRDVQDVFLAGNFLRPATVEEAHEFYTSSE